jgi:hypothetical protein
MRITEVTLSLDLCCFKDYKLCEKLTILILNFELVACFHNIVNYFYSSTLL